MSPEDATAATTLFSPVMRNWNVPCNTSGIESVRVVVDIQIGPDGRLVGQPRLVNPEDTAPYRAAAASAFEALRHTEPFEVPPNFAGGRYRPIFSPARVCAAR